jgi:hypothetical protein
MKRMKPPLRSGFVGRPPATSEKRSPINFTDLANPVSNRIYERIGYRRVGTRATIAW